jgi:nicotinate phosphoribosyltransferase
LLIDLYQLTMAQGLWRDGMQDDQASFVYNFRENPFSGGFAIFAGIEELGPYLENWHFSEQDCTWLSNLKSHAGTKLFSADFLDWLACLKPEFEVHVVSEGSIVFAGEPLVRVTGPLIACQLLETVLMNRVNFETLIATKAARCYIAAGGDSIFEFGLRRAQGPDGGISASRAAFIGGCNATSNLEAARRFGIPVAGTHAHSWVMAHDSEKAAFDSWTRSYPNYSVLLVDTYDSLSGIEEAVKAGAELEARGGSFAGIRLDSGDLAWLSKRARTMLDEAGLESAKIFASNDLDEHTILSLKTQGALIDSWGVGTRLSTGGDQSALGGVFKMTALKRAGTDTWVPKIKVSDQAIKTSTPGILGLRRYFDKTGKPIGDMIYDLMDDAEEDGSSTIVDPFDMTRQKRFASDVRHIEMLEPFFAEGRVLAPKRELSEIRKATLLNLEHLGKSHQRFMRPHRYAVGLEKTLFERQLNMIKEHKGLS